jgi:hypothetical protein
MAEEKIGLRDEIFTSLNGQITIWTYDPITEVYSPGEKITAKNFFSTPELTPEGVETWQNLLEIAVLSTSLRNLTSGNVLTQTTLNGVYATGASTNGLPAGINTTGILKAFNSGTTKFLEYSTINAGIQQTWKNYYDGTNWAGWVIGSGTSGSTPTLWDASLLDIDTAGDYYTGSSTTNYPTGTNALALVELKKYSDYKWLTYKRELVGVQEIWTNYFDSIDWSGWVQILTDLSGYATKIYAESLVTGLWDDRGNYNASGNTFPSTGGSGSAGAILKGDIWTITNPGTLGVTAVIAGQTVRALVDTPGQTASNWAISVGTSGSDHTELSNLNWEDSGHESGLTEAKLAAFDTSGLPVLVDLVTQSRLESYSTTATATGTTTLTVASNYMQYFTGILTQIVQMPVVSTLILGFQFKICNKSTGLITVNSSGSNLVCLVPAGTEVILTCIAITGTDAGSWSVEFKLPALTSTKVWMGNGSNIPTETDTESSALTVGNYTVDFPELAEESNWLNNVTNIISGVIGDRAFGLDELGSISESMYTQYGWSRDFTNSFITDVTRIAALETSGNWTKVTDVISTYNASQGDRGQTYYNNGYFYFCYGTSSHTWLRYGNLDTITTTDITYFPKPQVEVGKGHGDFFTIEGKFDITNIIVEAETTTAGNLIIGSTGTQEIASLVVTAACGTNGNAQVVLDGVTFNVALTTAQNSATLVATALRAFSYTGWTTGGTGTTVTFTSTKYKSCTDATYSDNGTGATGTMTTGTQGVDPNNDIVTIIALPTTIGQKKRLTYLVNVDFPTASNRNMYINISSAATIKLHLITQKMFE